MSKLTPCQRNAMATVRAARASRRSVLKGALALGVGVAAAPAFVRKAFSSSGELSWFTWEDYAPQPLVDKFIADTGIDLKVTTFSSNEDQLNKLKAAGGVGWDLATPSVAWVPAHVESGNLQALDFDRVPNLANVFPSFIEQSAGLGAEVDGKWYSLPYDWGTEAIAFNTELADLKYGEVSFGHLWDERFAGAMLCRQRSIMLGTGLWMEGTGELPEGTMRKAYDDPDALALGYGKAAEYTIAHKDQIVNWWKGTADTQSGFLQDGAAIGQTWDGPIFQMKNDGYPMQYIAPVEGALAWIDTIALTAGAENLEQAYAFINWAFMPENGGLASTHTTYNSVVKGFDAHVPDSFKKNFAEAYPEDAVDRLWMQGIEYPWFLEKRQELADKISAA